MRSLFLLPAAIALIGASDMPAPPVTDAPSPSPRSSEIARTEPAAPDREQCRDTITLAREAAGQPPLLDRRPASAENPYLIYAVDKRVDGCAVMVMKGNAADIRPLPAPAEEPLRQMPAARGK